MHGSFLNRTKSPSTYESLAVAEAQLDLARVRQAKLSLIERACAFADLDAGGLFGSAIRARGSLNTAWARSPEPDRSGEALRRLLPVLAKLDRYERRAAARRDRAVRALVDRKKSRYHF